MSLEYGSPAMRIPLHGALADKQSMPELWELRATRPFFAPQTFAGHIPSTQARVIPCCAGGCHV